MYALLASDADAWVNHAEVRDELDQALASIPDRFQPDRETWGANKEARAALAAAEAMAGGPAADAATLDAIWNRGERPARRRPPRRASGGDVSRA